MNRNGERDPDAPPLKGKKSVSPNNAVWSLFSAFRPFGASAKFLLQARPKAMRAQRSNQTGQEDLSNLRSTSEFRYFYR